VFRKPPPAANPATARISILDPFLTKIQHDHCWNPLFKLYQLLASFFTTIIGASISLPLELAKIDHLKQARTLMVDCSKVHLDTSTKCGGIHDGLARAQLPTTHPNRCFILLAVELAQLASG